MFFILKEVAQRARTNWDDLHSDYLQGVSILELSKKYNLSFNYLKNRISEKGWLSEKVEIRSTIEDEVKKELIEGRVNLASKYNARIESLVDCALDKLEEILNDENTTIKNLLSAIDKVLDISGLKIINQNTNSNHTERKIFITTNETAEVNNHIDSVIEAQVVNSEQKN